MPMDGVETVNYVHFRDCFSELAISRLSPSADKKQRKVKGRKNEIKPVARDMEQEHADAAEELSEFVDYIATEIFSSLSSDLQELSYRAMQEDASIKQRYSLPLDAKILETIVSSLPADTVDSMSTYGLADQDADISRVLEPVLETYIHACTATPPENDTLNQANECEICDRDQMPLTYHHLIPRQMHAKAIKRGWAKEWEVQRVAWLCRACHSFVHRILTNEELAKEWNEIDRLLKREDVRAWAQWVRRVRWKKR